MNTYHVDAWMAFPPHGMTRLASMLILMLAWSVGDGAAFGFEFRFGLRFGFDQIRDRQKQRMWDWG